MSCRICNIRSYLQNSPDVSRFFLFSSSSWKWQPLLPESGVTWLVSKVSGRRVWWTTSTFTCCTREAFFSNLNLLVPSVLLSPFMISIWGTNVQNIPLYLVVRFKIREVMLHQEALHKESNHSLTLIDRWSLSSCMYILCTLYVYSHSRASQINR